MVLVPAGLLLLSATSNACVEAWKPWCTWGEDRPVSMGTAVRVDQKHVRKALPSGNK